MFNILAEVVVASFTLGGVVGAIVALHLRARSLKIHVEEAEKDWDVKEAVVYSKDEQRRTRRR